MLSPKFVVLFVGDWISDFLSYINHGHTQSIDKCTWGAGNCYETKLYEIDNRYFIRTEHPQGKKEDEHINCLLSMMKPLK